MRIAGPSTSNSPRRREPARSAARPRTIARVWRRPMSGAGRNSSVGDIKDFEGAQAVDFALTFEQQTLVDSMAEFVKKELYPHEAIVEELRAVPKEIAADIHKKAKDAGFLAMNMPVEL